LAGCADSGDRGAPPPKAKAMTEAEKQAMPPEARAAMESAMKQGQRNAQTRGINGP
jgi:hypothetical protein